MRPSYKAFDFMVEFARMLADRRIQKKLYSALNGRGAFRRFKDTLREYTDVEKQWFQFKANRDKEEVKEWLESIGIELVDV